MFFKDTKAAYKILEIPLSATNEEVKKAFRKMATKFHPDKVAHLGEDHVQTAEDKFQKVQQAYDLIKENRNLN